MSFHSYDSVMVTSTSIAIINTYLIPLSQLPHTMTPVSCFAVKGLSRDHLEDRTLAAAPSRVTLKTSTKTETVTGDCVN